ncbi:MAG: peptidylprolyl isomerase [Thermodesulfobacteriota bacterium]
MTRFKSTLGRIFIFGLLLLAWLPACQSDKPESSSPDQKPAASQTAPPAGPSDQGKLVDPVAAVNGQPISRLDYDREVDRLSVELLKKGMKLEEGQQGLLQETALDNLVSRKLFFQESQDQGIKIEDAAIEEKMKELKSRFPSREEYLRALAEMKMTEDEVKTEFKQGLAVETLVNREIVQKTTVTEKDARDYFDRNPQFFIQPERVKASHILIMVKPEDGETKKAEAKARIAELRQKIQAGQDFAALAQEHSQCPSAKKGGDLGYIRRGQTVKPFEDAAFGLSPGQISGPIETNFGFHLIKVTDRTPEKQTPFEEIKDRLREHVRQENINKQVSDYLERLREKAKIEVFLPEPK